MRPDYKPQITEHGLMSCEMQANTFCLPECSLHNASGFSVLGKSRKNSEAVGKSSRENTGIEQYHKSVLLALLSEIN